MKVNEIIIMSEKMLIAPNSFDRKGSPLKLGNMYNNVNWGKRMKVGAHTVTVRSTGKDGQIYGRRTIMQKA